MPGVQARHDRLFALQSDPNAPVPLGEGRAASRPLLPRTPTPALSPGPPHLSGQQEFPFFCLPQLHHVRQGLNCCTDTKRHTAFVMHGKETLPVSSPVPPVPPACPKQVSFSSRSGGHPRGEPRMQIQCPAGAPLDRGGESMRAWSRPGGEAASPGTVIPGAPGWGNKAAGSRARRGTRAPHKAGDAPGAQGPAHKGSGARAASGPLSPALPAPDPGPRASEGTLRSQGCSSPSSPAARVPFLRDPSQISTVPQKKEGGRGGEDSEPRRRADLVPEPLPDGSRTAGPGRRPAEGSRQRPCGGRRWTAGAGAPPCWCSPRSQRSRSLACWRRGRLAAPRARPRALAPPRLRPRPPRLGPPPQLLDCCSAPALRLLRSVCARQIGGGGGGGGGGEGGGMERGGERRDEDNANARGAQHVPEGPQQLLDSGGWDSRPTGERVSS